MICAEQLRSLRQFAADEVAGTFPATIRIGGAVFAAGTSGLNASDPLADGGAEASRRISFLLSANLLPDPARPPFRGGDTLECIAPAALGGFYTLDEILADASGTSFTLRCVAQPQ